MKAKKKIDFGLLFLFYWVNYMEGLSEGLYVLVTVQAHENWKKKSDS